MGNGSLSIVNFLDDVIKIGSIMPNQHRDDPIIPMHHRPLINQSLYYCRIKNKISQAILIKIGSIINLYL
jgi:hypothetical protein